MAAHDVLARALLSSDLDVTCAAIQTALGITDGGLAGQCFSGETDYARYAALPDAHARAEFIASWLRYELAAAAERIASGEFKP